MRIRLWFLLLLIGSLTIYSCSNGSNPPEDQTGEEYDTGIEDDIISHEMEKMSKEEEERQQASDYLKLDATPRKNLKGGWVLKGILHNTASQAEFSSVSLGVRYFDRHDSLMVSLNPGLYGNFPAGSNTPIKVKLEGPKKAKRAEVKITRAE